ncbi:unnamed protein product [Ceratitis capitata]|uniref:(Mediterranean fruit fly) hypothetical protein n=1 Tax=Ceratitis capitata TaxID=7213 RepID=A0A811UWF4_CERCA|nr:unnamed protein product [Ceratitis capitata]
MAEKSDRNNLVTTRLAKFINHLRRRTKDDHLARRAKSLLKKWREMVGIQQQPQNQNETHIISKQPTSFENVLIGFGVTDNNLSITSDSSRFCSKLSQSAQQHVIPSDNTGAFIINQSSNSNSQMSLILPSSNRPPVLAPIVIDIQDSNSGSDLSASVLNATLNSKMPLCDPGRAQNEKKRKDKSQYSVHETEVTSNAKDTTVLVDETSSNQNCRLLSEGNSDKYSPFVNDEKSRLAYPEILSLLDNSSMSSMFPPESSPHPVDEQSKVNLSANDSLRTTFNLSLSDLSFAGKFKQGAALFPTSNELTGYKSHRPASIHTGPTPSKFTPFRGARSNPNDSNSQVSQPDLIEVISSDKMQGFQTQAKQGTLNLPDKNTSTVALDNVPQQPPQQPPQAQQPQTTGSASVSTPNATKPAAAENNNTPQPIAAGAGQ